MSSITIHHSMTLSLQSYEASSSALFEFFALTPADGGEVVFLDDNNERIFINKIVVNYTTKKEIKETSNE